MAWRSLLYSLATLSVLGLPLVILYGSIILLIRVPSSLRNPFFIMQNIYEFRVLHFQQFVAEPRDDIRDYSQSLFRTKSSQKYSDLPVCSKAENLACKNELGGVTWGEIITRQALL
jgi:hypothetical protein